MLHYLFSLCPFRLIKCSFFMHSTTPYVHPRLDSRIGPRFSDCIGASGLSFSQILKVDCVHEQQVVVSSQHINLI